MSERVAPIKFSVVASVSSLLYSRRVTASVVSPGVKAFQFIEVSSFEPSEFFIIISKLVVMVALAMVQDIDLSLVEALRRIPHRLTKMRSHSFYRYFHNLKMLGWVRLTGEEEGSMFGGMPGARVERTPAGTTLVEVPQPRRFYKLTTKGYRAGRVAWNDPLQALYHYAPEYRSPRPTEKLYRPGSLPRKGRPKALPK